MPTPPPSPAAPTTTTTTTAEPIDVPSLLRLLTQSSLPLTTAITKIPLLRTANLTSIAAIASAPLKTIRDDVFDGDEKIARKVVAAAKKACKKRGADGDDADPVRKTRKRNNEEDEGEGEAAHDPLAGLEADLALPSFSSLFPTHTSPSATMALLRETSLITNRAPLLLAFTLVTLQFTMPQLLGSSRLSLAQAVVAEGARKRARELGIVAKDAKGKKEEEDGWGGGGGGGGGRSVMVMGRRVRVMRRVVGSGDGRDGKKDVVKEEEEEHEALWALDPDSSNTLTFSSSPSSHSARSALSSLPIHNPYTAHAYLLKSFASAPSSDPTSSTSTTTTSTSTSPKPKLKPPPRSKNNNQANLALLLQALHILFTSWAKVLSKEDLDRRAWSWYVAVRPDVAEGKAGWGGKGCVELGRVVGLCRVVEGEGDGVKEGGEGG